MRIKRLAIGSQLSSRYRITFEILESKDRSRNRVRDGAGSGVAAKIALTASKSSLNLQAEL